MSLRIADLRLRGIGRQAAEVLRRAAFDAHALLTGLSRARSDVAPLAVRAAGSERHAVLAARVSRRAHAGARAVDARAAAALGRVRHPLPAAIARLDGRAARAARRAGPALASALSGAACGRALDRCAPSRVGVARDNSVATALLRARRALAGARTCATHVVARIDRNHPTTTADHQRVVVALPRSVHAGRLARIRSAHRSAHLGRLPSARVVTALAVELFAAKRSRFAASDARPVFTRERAGFSGLKPGRLVALHHHAVLTLRCARRAAGARSGIECTRVAGVAGGAREAQPVLTVTARVTRVWIAVARTPGIATARRDGTVFFVDASVVLTIEARRAARNVEASGAVIAAAAYAAARRAQAKHAELGRFTLLVGAAATQLRRRREIPRLSTACSERAQRERREECSRRWHAARRTITAPLGFPSSYPSISMARAAAACAGTPSSSSRADNASPGPRAATPRHTSETRGLRYQSAS